MLVAAVVSSTKVVADLFPLPLQVIPREACVDTRRSSIFFEIRFPVQCAHVSGLLSRRMPLALMKSADHGPYQKDVYADTATRTGFPDLRLAPVFIIRRARSPDLCVSGLAQTASAALSG